MTRMTAPFCLLLIVLFNSSLSASIASRDLDIRLDTKDWLKIPDADLLGVEAKRNSNVRSLAERDLRIFDRILLLDSQQLTRPEAVIAIPQPVQPAAASLVLRWLTQQSFSLEPATTAANGLANAIRQTHSFLVDQHQLAAAELAQVQVNAVQIFKENREQMLTAASWQPPQTNEEYWLYYEDCDTWNVQFDVAANLFLENELQLPIRKALPSKLVGYRRLAESSGSVPISFYKKTTTRINQQFAALGSVFFNTHLRLNDQKVEFEAIVKEAWNRTWDRIEFQIVEHDF